MEQQAIQAALNGQWKKAITLNEDILNQNPLDMEALTRIAFAYAKLGNFTKACRTYHTVLKRDPFNPIAKKNFAKYKDLKNCIQKKETGGGMRPLSPTLFLVDHQKTKSVTLINAAPKSELNNLSAGEEVFANKRGYDLQVKNSKGTYVGTLPDDMSHIFSEMMRKGISCLFFIKDINDRSVTVFIKWGPQ